MKKTFLISLIMIGVTAVPTRADNIANCEVAVMEPLMDEGEPSGAEIAAFYPAAEFMASVYDDEDGAVLEVEGKPIRAVLCQRRDILPTLRDFPVVATGIPFSISNNFDSAESRMISVYFKAGEFTHKFVGDELAEKEETALMDILEVFNLQPHDLGEK